jgi:Ras-related protein Rab-1A
MNNTKKSYDELFKLVIVGDSGVGKSCFLLRYADNAFTESFISTIGVDFRFKSTSVNDKRIKLQIWDTAGQERFRAITSAYYKSADGIIFVYDITHKDSFIHVTDWINEARRYIDADTPLIIVGNKSDRTDRSVYIDELEKLAKANNTLFVECSARSSDNIDKVFNDIAKLLIKKSEEKDLPIINNVNIIPHIPKPNKCC